MRTVCVSGRFQPLHHDHIGLLTHVLDRGDRLVVAITNPDPGAHRQVEENAERHLLAANPFTYLERQQMVRAALAALGSSASVDVVPFPLHDPSVWASYVPRDAVQLVRVWSPWEERKVVLLTAGGHQVEVLRPEGSKLVSGTRIREQLAAGDPAWRQSVPAAVAAVVDAALADRPLRERAATTATGVQP